MKTSGDVEVFFYGRRRSAMLTRFARDGGLRHHPRDSDGSLEEELGEKLRIEAPGKGRAFSLIRDIVTDGEIAIFRCIEALAMRVLLAVALVVE